MPFYFQAALDKSPLRSGVDYMALAVPQMIGLLAGGGIVTAWGQYVRGAALPITPWADGTYSRCLSYCLLKLYVE